MTFWILKKSRWGNSSRMNGWYTELVGTNTFNSQHQHKMFFSSPETRATACALGACLPLEVAKHMASLGVACTITAY